MGMARFPDTSAYFGKGSIGLGFGSPVTLARAISVERVGQENTEIEYDQQRYYDLGHRSTPRVATMPTRAVFRKCR
jgi:hypothetical protein